MSGTPSQAVATRDREPLLVAPPPVVVRGLGKTFHVPHERYSNLKERVVDRFRSEPPEELRALDDVSFDIQRGECLGIAGRNGSGKSTLLRCLAGIYDYDEGTIMVDARLAPFVELGVDLRGDLTARDNVLLNAVMLGLSRAEARDRLDEMLVFAGLEDHGEMKLRNLSAGMKVRLAFSVAIQVDADVLLVDEVLAVGDSAFQRRCFEVFDRLTREGRTVVLVTHDMDALQDHSDRVLLLEQGRLVDIGEPARMTQLYEQLNAQRFRPHEKEAIDPSELPGNGKGAHDVALRGELVSAEPGASARTPAAFGGDLRRLVSVTGALTETEFKLHYLDSALGYLWAVMRPLLMFLVLYTIFDGVAGLGNGVEHYAVYLITAVVLWTFFTETAGASVSSLQRGGELMRKLHFPRLAIPLSISAKALINLGANSLVVVIFVAAAGLTPQLSWLQLPLLIALLAVFATGLGMFLSVAFVRYRDTAQVWALSERLLFFGSPIIYTASRYPEQLQEVFSLSPIAAIFTQTRHALIDPSAPTAAEAVGGTAMLLVPLGIIAATVALGLWLFRREAPRLAERI